MTFTTDDALRIAQASGIKNYSGWNRQEIVTTIEELTAALNQAAAEALEKATTTLADDYAYAAADITKKLAQQYREASK